MPQFKDVNSDTWPLELSVGLAIQLRKATEGKYNLLEPESKLGDGRTLREALFNDIAEFWEFLFCLSEEEAKRRFPEEAANGTLATKFAKLLNDERLVEAQSLFLQEWRDFFRRLQRHDTAMVLEKMAIYQEKAVMKVKEKLKDSKLTNLDVKVEEAMDRELNKSFSNSLEQLESILAPSPGDNSTG